MSIIYFILVLGITILVHEFGHFIFAKKAGIYVYEFSIGMGPRILKFTRKNDETIYAIRLFPIGGFVSLAGEEVSADEEISEDKKLYNKTWMQRFLTIIAGVMFNFILAIILLFIVGLMNGVAPSHPTIDKIDKKYPIYKENIKSGDIIVGINNKKVNNTDRLLLELQISNGKQIVINLKDKSGNQKNITVKPLLIKEKCNKHYAYGFTLDTTKKTGIIVSIKYAFLKTFSLLEQMICIIIYLFSGQLSLNNLAGPVGMFTIISAASKAGIVNVLYLIAYLCVNVGFINLIPFPAFDGGRIFMLILEKIRGKKIKPNIENTINLIGFMLLMLLMIVITYNDVLRIFK